MHGKELVEVLPRAGLGAASGEHAEVTAGRGLDSQLSGIREQRRYVPHGGLGCKHVGAARDREHGLAHVGKVDRMTLA